MEMMEDTRKLVSAANTLIFNTVMRRSSAGPLRHLHLWHSGKHTITRSLFLFQVAVLPTAIPPKVHPISCSTPLQPLALHDLPKLLDDLLESGTVDVILRPAVHHKFDKCISCASCDSVRSRRRDLKPQTLSADKTSVSSMSASFASCRYLAATERYLAAVKFRFG